MEYKAAVFRRLYLLLGLFLIVESPFAIAGPPVFLVIQSVSENHVKESDEECQQERVEQFEQLVGRMNHQTRQTVGLVKIRISDYRKLTEQTLPAIPKSAEVVGIYFVGHGNEEAFVPAKGEEGYFRARAFAPILKNLLEALGPRIYAPSLLLYFSACMAAKNENGFLQKLSQDLTQNFEKLVLVGYIEESWSGELRIDRAADDLLLNPQKLHNSPHPHIRLLGRLLAVPFLMLPLTVYMDEYKVSPTMGLAVIFGSAAGYFLISYIARNYKRIPAEDRLHVELIKRVDTHRHVWAFAITDKGTVEKIGPTVDITALSGFLRGGVDELKNCAARLALPIQYE